MSIILSKQVQRYFIIFSNYNYFKPIQLFGKYFRLSWNKLEGGWQIEICGGNRSIDMSAYKFVPKETGPFRTEYVGFFFPDARSVGTGPKVWLLTPAQEPILGHRNGARQENPPLAKVTQFLQTLENKGCKIVTSHSSSFEDGAPPVSVWTLEQGKYSVFWVYKIKKAETCIYVSITF